MAGELKLQTKIIKYLKSQQIWHVKTVESNRSGIPDIIGCKNGRFFAIEVKSPDNYNKATNLQLYELAQIAKSGGKQITSRDYQEILFFIDNV